MPLNQLLHDEQVTLIHAAAAKGPREAEAYRRRLSELDDEISAFPLRNHGKAHKAECSTPTQRSPTLQLTLELASVRLAGIEYWADVWGTSRSETVLRLIDRGMGQSSTFMRAS